MWVKRCSLQVFVHLEFFSLFEVKQLAGYLRPYFCLLRACWPYCPSASTRWTCTTVLLILRRRLVKRLERRGRTFLTSSMNCWVSDHEISDLQPLAIYFFLTVPQPESFMNVFIFIHGTHCNYFCICIIAGRNLLQWRTVSVFLLQDLFLPSINKMSGGDFICYFQSCVLIYEYWERVLILAAFSVPCIIPCLEMSHHTHLIKE